MNGQTRRAAPILALLALSSWDSPTVADTQVSAVCGVAAGGSIEVGGSVWIDCTPSKLVDLMEEQQAFRKSQLKRIQGVARHLGVSDCAAEDLLAKVAREDLPARDNAARLAELSAELRSAAADQDTVDAQAVVSEGSIEVARHLVVGLPPQELNDLMQQVRKVDESYLVPIENLGRALKFNRCATARFLEILGEEQVPEEQLSAKLTQIAKQHTETIAELNALTTQDPQITELRKLATQEMEDGNYEAAKERLAIAQDILDQKAEKTSAVMQDKASVAAVRGRVELLQLRYQDAADLFEKAALYSVDAGNPGDRAHYLVLAGTAFQDGGFYRDAFSMYEDALESYEENPDASPPEAVIKTLIDMGGLHFSQSDYANAKERFDQALEKIRQSGGDIDVDMRAALEAATYNGLADVNVALSEYDTAEEHYAQALSLMEFLYSAASRSLLPTVTNWAWLETNRGEYPCAESLFRRARAISNSGGNSQSLDAAATENNLATLYYKTGKYDEAERLWAEVKETYGKKLGETHPATLVVSQNIARALRNKGKTKEAEKIYLYALSVWKNNAKKNKQVDRSHLVIASLHGGLGDLYYGQDRFKEAKKQYEKAISLADSQLDDSEAVANSLLIAGYEHDLGIVHEELGEYEDAVEHLEKAVNIMAKKLPENHPDLGTASNSLARVLMHLDRPDEAVPHQIRSIAIAERTQQPLKVASRSRELAAIYKDLGRLEEARHNLEVAREVYEDLDPEQAEQLEKTREEVDRELVELHKEPKH